MERTPVESSLLKSVGFEDGVLEAELQTGQVYRYSGVERTTFDALLAAPSVGAFFNAHVKKSCTSCTRVVADEPDGIEAESLRNA